MIKVELPGRGDITRGQLRDKPNVDSLYFTMLNCNKRSTTLNTKTKKGKEIFRELIRRCDILVENFAPGALDRQGFTWEAIQGLNPRIIYASVKGFGPGPFEDCKVYENVAQCTLAALPAPPASTMARRSSPGRRSAIPGQASTWRRAFSRRSSNVRRPAEDSALPARCRTRY